MAQSTNKILLVLPRGEAIRNFILSGTADVLAKAHKLAIISVLPNKELEDKMRSLTDEFYILEDEPQPYIARFLRQQLDIVHGRWLWSEAAKERWMLRDHEANTLPKKIKRSLLKALAYPFTGRQGVKFVSALENVVSEKIYPTDKFVELIRKINPALAFNGSHIHCQNAVPVMHAARKLGIKTATFLFSWDNLTSQGRIMPPCNQHLVWNDQIKSHFLEIYDNVKPEQVSVTGTPQFDFHFHKDKLWSREDYCAKIGADPTRPIALYTTGMANHMPGEHITVERIGDMLNTFPEATRPQLVVRVYPKDKTGRFEDTKSRRKDIIFPHIPWEPNYLTPMPEDLILWTNMLQHCELGINVASTVALELCMFNKPALNVAYNPVGVNIFPIDYSRYYTWDHFKPIVDSGALYVAYSEEQLLSFIHQGLNHPQEKEAQRKSLLQGFFGNTLDGNSYIRIAEVLSKVADNSL